MFWVVLYDIEDDGRRTKVYDQLCNFGTPVQKSVVELAVGRRQLALLRRRLRKLVEPEDRILIASLCERDRCR